MLPSRYSPAVQEGVIQQAEVLSRADREGAEARRPWLRVVAVALPLGAFGLAGLQGRERAQAESSAPFGRDVVIGAQTAGVRADLEAFAALDGEQGRAATQAAAAPMEPPADELATTTLPTPEPLPSTRPGGGQGGRPGCKSCSAQRSAAPSTSVDTAWAGDDAGGDVVVNEDAGYAINVEAAPESQPRVLNVGTRIRVVLTDPLVTGASGVPVLGRIEADVVDASGQTLVPAGTTTVGEAFATAADDRVRIVFTALVADGQTVPVTGIALARDAQVGVPGHLVRKASKQKRGRNLLLRAGASALGATGLGGEVGGMVGAAASELSSGVVRELEDISQQWGLSDKGLRLTAGTPVVLFLRQDVRLP